MSKGTDLMSGRQIKGLERLGDVMLPGGSGLPSFSASGAARSIDHVVRYLPEQDRKDLGLLLTILGLFPAFFCGFFVWLMEKSVGMPGPLGALLRFARIGTRGLVMSLYWGDEKVLAAIDYEVGVFTADLEPAANSR